MTDVSPKELTDIELVRELGELLYGREQGPGRPVAWQRECARAMGIHLSQLQAIVAGRPPSLRLRAKLADWVRAAIRREEDARFRKRVLLKELRDRLK